MDEIKYKWDNELGVLEVSILEKNYGGYDSLLLVQLTIIGEKREDFPNKNSYYTYGTDTYYYRHRVNKVSRSKNYVMSIPEWEKLHNSKDEVLEQEVNLYTVNLFNSDKPYSYVSYRELEINSYSQVNVRGRKVNGFIVSKIGKTTIKKVLECQFTFIE